MALTKVLITVKTYPSISTKYDELVCTAGFKEDGTWVRIYPIPFRKLDFEDRYEKYQWIEIDLIRNRSDFRPETYRPKDTDFVNIKPLEKINTDNNWQKRKEIVLKNGFKTNLTELIQDAHNKSICTSLAVFKPKQILDFVVEKTEREWDKKKLEKVKNDRAQLKLFKKFEKEDLFDVVKKLPYKFSYKFIDENDRESTMMIEDWEIGQLYWNCLKKYNFDEKVAVQKVKDKYWNNFVKNNDLYFFLGTTKQNHYVSITPFIIIGLFYPLKESQLKLF